MSFRFIDGFDHYNAADLISVWSGATQSAGTYWFFDTGRFGGQCVAFKPFGINNFIYKDLPSPAPYNNFIVGFAFKYTATSTSNSPLCIIGSGSGEQFSVYFKNDATLQFYRAGNPLSTSNDSGYGPLVAGVWNYIEIQAHIASGGAGLSNCFIRVNAQPYQEINPGEVVDPQGTGTMSRFSLGVGSAVVDFNNYWRFDDVYFLNVDGATSGVTGDVRVETLYPSGAGAQTGLNLTGAATNWQAVGETFADGDTSFVYGDTAAQGDTYQFSDLSSIPTTIYCAQVNMWAKKDATGTRQINAIIYIGGTNYYSSSIPMFSSYFSIVAMFTGDPSTGTAWTGAGINGAQFGVGISV